MGNSISLKGKTALVTGASSGLGERFAEVLAEAGATLVLAARSVEKLEALSSRLKALGGKAYAVRMDVTDVASIKEGFAEAEKLAGHIHILVNNSGVSAPKRIIDMDERDYDYQMDTNAKGAYFVAQAAGRSMISNKVEGRIINIASAAGLRYLNQLSVYSMSKAAVIMMTRAMAAEWTRFGINVNAICPGYIVTEINRAHWETEGGKKLINMLPRHRVGDPKDLDGLLLLLASEQSRFINGAIISADDGMTAT